VSYSTHGKLGNGVPSEICEHGHLARSCERCDDRREIERLRSEVKRLQEIADYTECEANDCGHIGVVYVCHKCRVPICEDCYDVENDMCYDCSGGGE
jgi:hypothetical protein